MSAEKTKRMSEERLQEIGNADMESDLPTAQKVAELWFELRRARASEERLAEVGRRVLRELWAAERSGRWPMRLDDPLGAAVEDMKLALSDEATRPVDAALSEVES